MEAFRLPKTNSEQAEEKDRAVEDANKEATLVPLEVLKKSVEAVALARVAAAKGNRNSVSDAGVGGLAGQAAGEGAYYNVLINLPAIKDAAFTAKVKRDAARLKKALDKEAKAVKDIVARALSGPKA
jgi:formiminotetrahydrofolate cyclodeaminase